MQPRNREQQATGQLRHSRRDGALLVLSRVLQLEPLDVRVNVEGRQEERLASFNVIWDDEITAAGVGGRDNGRVALARWRFLPL